MRQLQRKTSKHLHSCERKFQKHLSRNDLWRLFSWWVHRHRLHMHEGSSWQWSYGSWFYNYLCNQYLSQHRCRDWYGSLGLTPVPIWKMPCMIWKISCHNIFITYLSLTFFQALSFILQKRSLNWQIAKKNP